MNILRLSWSSYQSDESLQAEAEAIREPGYRYLRPRESGPRPGKLATYDVIIINSQFEVDEVFLNHWNNDGLILTASSGYNHIDLDACERYGVTVGRTPLCRARNVCDYVKSVLQLYKRDFHRTGHPVRSTFWDRPEAFGNVRDLGNIRLGILGFGVIGQHLCEELDGNAFDAILVNDPLKEEAVHSSDFAEYVPVDELVESVDVLTLHADLNASTRGIIHQSVLKKMPDSGFLVNSARGSMVDVQALRAALSEGSLSGAALDVLPEEPPENPDVLRDEGLFVTPHSAGFGPSLIDDLTDEILRNLEAYEDTGQVNHPVTRRSEAQRDRLEAQRDALG